MVNMKPVNNTCNIINTINKTLKRKNSLYLLKLNTENHLDYESMEVCIITLINHCIILIIECVKKVRKYQDNHFVRHLTWRM